MDFRILGPLEVRDRGRPIELRRQKQKALLALLLLYTRQPVSSDALIEGLWGEEPPATSRSALRNYVSQLRAALGGQVLSSRGGGYVLDVAPEEIDLHRFERLAAEARSGSAIERREKLREALALWRGPALAGLEFEPFAGEECRRLEELYLATREELLDAELALGAGAERVGELEAAVASSPFRERLRGQLMLALYQAGRQAEALEAYRETRRVLVDELGLEPGDALRKLEQAILRHDPRLAAPALRVQQELEPAPEERRATVTVLFAEIACPEQLDPELLRTTTVRVFNGVRAALEEHGATVEQRSGDEVMAVFGLPRAHEDDPLRALRAAVEVQQVVAAHGDVLEQQGWGRLRGRVGVATGEVLAGADEAGHGFVAGGPVLLARQALHDASSAEIRAGRETVELLGDAVITDGAADGGNAVTVVDVAEGAVALHRHLEAPLVGRERELAALQSVLARVIEQRQCRLVLLLGEPGIGKTRLTRELVAELDPATRVLTGSCVSYGRGATYLPLAELLRPLRAERALELLGTDEQARQVAAGLAELLGEAGPPVPRSDMFWALRRLLEALASERPLLLVFEDLHWAEPTLLDLVDYLTEQASAAPILVLGVARPELLEDRPAWRADDSIELGPLSSEAGDALVRNLAEISPQLCSRIVRAAGGNPLFLEQLLAHSGESGDPETAPRSLTALLASRLDRLKPGELSLLQRAAVAGLEFQRGAVVQLAPEEQAPAIAGQLHALTRKGLLREAPVGLETLAFQHALIRDAAYATLPKTQRAALHERFGRWLDQGGTGSDEAVGFHLEQAHGYLLELGAGDAQLELLAREAGEKLGPAGLRAWRRADTAAAVDLLGRAAALLSRDDALRLELLCELGLAMRTAGDIERASAVLQEAGEAAAAAGERRLELRARMELANVQLSAHPHGSADTLLQLAADAIPTFEALGDDRSLGRAWLLSGYVHGGLHCRNAAWLDAAEHSLKHYRRSGWPLSTCEGEIATALYYGPVPVPEGIRRCRQLLSEVGGRTGEAHVLLWLGGLEAFAGELELGRSLVERARAVYEELGYGMALACGCLAVLAEIELLAGDLDATEQALTASCERLDSMGERACLASRAAELSDVLYTRGRYDDAER
jgi:DNA-binding SARP family transcriptional activator